MYQPEDLVVEGGVVDSEDTATEDADEAETTDADGKGTGEYTATVSDVKCSVCGFTERELISLKFDKDDIKKYLSCLMSWFAKKIYECQGIFLPIP